MPTHLSHCGANMCPFHLYLSLPALTYDLFRNSAKVVVQRGNWSFRLAGGGGAVGGKTSQNLCYLYNSIRNCCSHASSCRTLMILLFRFDKFTINSSLIETILWQRFFGYFVCFVLSPLSEGNDAICDIKIAYHVENSLPNKFLMLIWG